MWHCGDIVWRWSECVCVCARANLCELPVQYVNLWWACSQRKYGGGVMKVARLCYDIASGSAAML
jgi:hypothetical protein